MELKSLSDLPPYEPYQPSDFIRQALEHRKSDEPTTVKPGPIVAPRHCTYKEMLSHLELLESGADVALIARMTGFSEREIEEAIYVRRFIPKD